MKLLDFFRSNKTSAPVARERLQIILAHERSANNANSDLLITLREEILAVIAKHMPVERDKVNVTMERGDGVSLLEVDVELPMHDDRGLPVKITAAA